MFLGLGWRTPPATWRSSPAQVPSVACRVGYRDIRGDPLERCRDALVHQAQGPRSGAGVTLLAPPLDAAPRVQQVVSLYGLLWVLFTPVRSPEDPPWTLPVHLVPLKDYMVVSVLPSEDSQWHRSTPSLTTWKFHWDQ